MCVARDEEFGRCSTFLFAFLVRKVMWVCYQWMVQIKFDAKVMFLSLKEFKLKLLLLLKIVMVQCFKIKLVQLPPNKS